MMHAETAARSTSAGESGADDFGRREQEAATIAFVSEFNSFRDEMEALLEALPHRPSDARRLITRDWAIEPGVGELETIVSIALDQNANGPRRELPRRLLMLRVLAERELSRLFGDSKLERDRLQKGSDLAPKLLAELKAVEEEFRMALASMEGLSLEDRDFLLQVIDSLMIRKEPLLTAQLLGPRLASLASVQDSGDAFAVAPCLTPEEAEMFAQASLESGSDSPGRVCLDAIALRSLIQEDLEQWRRHCDSLDFIERQTLLERMQLEALAYETISERLQKQQDAAIQAELPDYIEELQSVRNGLFSAYMQLVAVTELPSPLAAPSGWVEPQESPAAQTANLGFKSWLLVGLVATFGMALGLVVGLSI